MSPVTSAIAIAAINVKSLLVNADVERDSLTIRVNNMPQMKYIQNDITIGLISGISDALSNNGFERTWIKAAVIAAAKIR